MPNWSQVLVEINQFVQASNAQARGAVDIIRRKYLGELATYTGRNVIAYYSGWLSKPNIIQSEINDEDKNGFMMAVHGLDRKIGLDLILHTPGGSIAATQSIADYLHKMFKRDIRAIVPQIAMSAGTMLACSCQKIIMAKHSNLGPIDPHLNGVPAYGVIQEFKRALKEVKADPSTADVWRSIIGQYRPTFLGQCANAIAWSNTFVRTELVAGMFKGKPDAAARARKVVKKLTDYTGNRTHGRHIHFDECTKVGLDTVLLEDDKKLQDLVLTVHHCYMHSLMNTAAYKMIENHKGTALVKQQQQVKVVQAAE
jgi:serine dehydrogenase proteinase